MTCNKSRNNLLLIYVGLFFFSSLSQCTNPEKQFQKRSISPSKNLHWRRGKLLIGLKIGRDEKSKEATYMDLDYQSDTVWEVPEHKMVQPYAFPGYDNAAVERLLKMNPTVDCSGGHMRLQVKDADSRPGALLFVDRGNLTPLSLSKLPKSCGYQVASSRRDFVMVAPYDGCFVLVEESCYVLPLRWFGLPVQMSCPLNLASANTPMVTCYPGGMVIETDWTSAMSEIKVNLKDKWEFLDQVSPKCMIGVDGHSEGIRFSILYQTCVEIKDGMYVVKLSGDDDVKISCPLLSTKGLPPQLMMDTEQVSSTTPSVKTTLHSPHYDMPQMQSQTWDQIFSWPGLNPAQPIDEDVVVQYFHPRYPPSMPGWEYNSGHYPFSIFQPNMPPMTAFDQEQRHPVKPENPSVGIPPLHGPVLWDWHESQPFPPFYLPQVPYEPTTTLKPKVSPTYSCPYAPSTEGPKVTTASPLAAVQHYSPFGLYYPDLFQHMSHTAPTPSTQKTQDPPISHPGTVVLYPKDPQLEMGQQMECLQHCQMSLLDCCPQIAFHEHHYHFVPQQQNGNLDFPLVPLAEMPNVFRPDSLHIQSQDPQEAPAPPSHTTFTNGFVSPQLYPFGGRQEVQPYHRPQESNPAASPGNQPREQTDSLHAYFNNAYFPHTFDINPWNPPIQPEGTSTGAHSRYSELFKPAQGTNLNAPFNVQSYHQSDGPPSNTQPPHLLSGIRQHASQSVNNANIDVEEPPLVIRPQQDPFLVPYGMLQEQHISNLQPSDAMRRTPRDYVLLQHGPPGRERGDVPPPQLYNPVVAESGNVGQSFDNNLPKEPLNLRRATEDPKWLDGKDQGKAGQTDGDEPGRLQHSASAGPSPPPLSQNPVNGQPFRYPHGLVATFGPRHRTSQRDIS